MTDTATDPNTPLPSDTGLLDGNDSGVDLTGKSGAQQVPDGNLLSGDEGSEHGGVPEAYTFDLPEGVDVEVTEEIQEALDHFSSAARDMGLSQAQYQALVEYDLQRAQAAEETAVGEWVERVNNWKSSSLKDREIGNENYPETKASATATLRKFGTPALTELLKDPDPQNPNGLALGNHPEILRLLSRVGKALGDPAPIDGKETAGSDEQRRLETLYPTMFKKQS
jgi:hypothetical protein